MLGKYRRRSKPLLSAGSHSSVSDVHVIFVFVKKIQKAYCFVKHFNERIVLYT